MEKRILFFAAIAVLFIFCTVINQKFITKKSLTLPVTQNVPSLHLAGEKMVPQTVRTIVVIMMENKSYASIVGNADAPYSNALMHTYGLAADYFAVAHPSLPNYIALIGGSTFGITSDCTDCFIHAQNLIDQLDSVHKTWGAYMESMPAPCTISSYGEYAQKHDPFVYFDDIRNNPERCSHIVPLSQLSVDLQSVSTTPDFIWITPNLCNDMHDCSTRTGDGWLAQEVPRILQSPVFTKEPSLLVITWDEGEGSGNNHVPAIIAGSVVKHGFVSQLEFTHYSLLHTIETLWNMPALTANTQKSNVLTDFLNKA